MFDKDDWLKAMGQIPEPAGTGCRRVFVLLYARANGGVESSTHAMRPPDRIDDVALAPRVGSRYSTANPRVVVVMMNPGQKTAQHKFTRQDLGQQLNKGDISYEEYNRKLADLVPKWGVGGIKRWLNAISLEPESIAFLNIALCAVANDDYFPELFETCFSKHTRKMVQH